MIMDMVTKFYELNFDLFVWLIIKWVEVLDEWDSYIYESTPLYLTEIESIWFTFFFLVYLCLQSTTQHS